MKESSSLLTTASLVPGLTALLWFYRPAPGDDGRVMSEPDLQGCSCRDAPMSPIPDGTQCARPSVYLDESVAEWCLMGRLSSNLLWLLLLIKLHINDE